VKEEKIVITQQDFLEYVVDEVGEGRLYVESEGPLQINEFSDYITKKGGVIRYHLHKAGHEIFIVTKGSVEIVIGGKRCIANPGDMMLIKPYTPHAFRYLEEGTTWEELIQGLALYDGVWGGERIRRNCIEKRSDPKFMQKYEKANAGLNLHEIQALEEDLVPSEQVPGFSGKGQCYKEFNIPGIRCALKYPRWDLGDVKEIWEYTLENGVSVSWDDYYPDSDFFAVRKGKVSVETQGYGTLTANEGDLIYIPNYTLHKITSLESGTVLHDFNCRHNLFFLLEELTINKRLDPGSITSDYIKELFLRYDCPITAIDYPAGGISLHI